MSIYAFMRLVRGISVLRDLTRLVAVFAVVSTGGPVVAADFSGDMSVDSAIEMTSEGGDGSMSVKISTVLSATKVLMSRNGRLSEAAMPYEECSDLWQYLLDRDVGALTDAPVKNPLPDQAFFTFTFRSGTESHTFSAYGVDFLADTRYQEIAMAIIQAAKKYE